MVLSSLNDYKVYLEEHTAGVHALIRKGDLPNTVEILVSTELTKLLQDVLQYESWYGTRVVVKRMSRWQRFWFRGIKVKGRK